VFATAKYYLRVFFKTAYNVRITCPGKPMDNHIRTHFGDVFHIYIYTEILYIHKSIFQIYILYLKIYLYI